MNPALPAIERLAENRKGGVHPALPKSADKA